MEEPVSFSKSASAKQIKDAEVVALKHVETDQEERIKTKIEELDRVLGGGIVPGSLLLVGGDPGIGKSTLLLQVCQRLCEDKHQVLYISGEESLKQIKLRANRMGEFTEDLLLLCETNLEIVKNVIQKRKPEVVIIDSIQTMYSEEVASAPGSVSQVRESTNVFMQLAKGLGISIFIVGHVTKEGTVAGPRVLEHMVDTVLYFEGDRHASYRILRGVKNRFGSTNEIGVFEMRQNGLGMPRRTAAGTEYNRVNLLMAVLEKRVGIHLSNYDAYVNIAGGIKMNEPAVDLGIVMAIVSSYKNQPIDEKTIVFGEVGLSGEVRAVNMPEQRVAEAKKLGFTTCIMPEVSREVVKNIKGIKIIGVKTINEALQVL